VNIADGSRLESLDILPALRSVSGAGLQVLGARQVGAAPGLASLRTVDGQLFLVATQLASLSNFGNLARVSDSAILINNHNLTSLGGLGALTAVGGQLVLSLNARLASLSGLEGLTEVGTDPAARGFVGLSVANNTRLTSVAGLGGLRRVGGTLQVANNPALMSLAGLGGVAEVGDAAGSGASAGVAHAGVAITGNSVLRDISALAGLGRCGGGGAGAPSPAPASKRPSVRVEVFLETGVVSAATPPPAAPAAAAEQDPATGLDALPAMPNDFGVGRTPGGGDGAGAGGSATGGDVAAPGARPAPPDAAKPGLAGPGPIPGLANFASRRPAAREPAPVPVPAVVASRAEAAAAGASSASAAAVGGGGAAPKDAASLLSVQLQSRGGGLLSRLLPPAPWARGAPAPSSAADATGAAAPPPPGPRRPFLPPLPPFPSASPPPPPAPAAAPAGVDPLLLQAVNASPDTKCTLTTWDQVCAFIASGGSVPAGHAWRGDGTCVGYVKPVTATPGRAVVGLTIG